MPGLEYGEELPVHNELDALAGSFLKTIVTNPNGKLSPVWRKAYDGIIDAYLGKIPEKFTYNGKEYTPKMDEANRKEIDRKWKLAIQATRLFK